MEQFPNNEQPPEEKKVITIDSTSDSEYHIIDTGIKKIYIPKWKKIPVNGVWIDTQKLIQASMLYPDSKPGEALEKLAKEHPEIK